MNTPKEAHAQAKTLIARITALTAGRDKPLRYMEVCGTHTVSIFRAGLRQILPPSVELVSGPGCPVCVTPDSYMDKAIAYAHTPGTIVATFGDMLKVPGSSSSLQQAMAEGADVRVVYSPLDAVALAASHPKKRVVFLAVGFETTAPTTAAAVLTAKRQGLSNFLLLTATKCVPPAMRLLLEDPLTEVDGFLLPGHVAVVTGLAPFSFIAKEFQKPGVVAGFAPMEILTAICHLAEMSKEGTARIENAYPRVVRESGNPVARAVLDEVCEITGAEWRGLGVIQASGWRIKNAWRAFDIEALDPITVTAVSKKTACRCGDVLKGQVTPPACPLFGCVCTPEHAAGPCMVSVEGVCAAWYKYGGGQFHYGR